MPTNEERREVASRLRNAEIENLSIYEYSTHLGEAIGECVRLVSGHEVLVERGLNRLANLIEPEPERTCRFRNDGRGILWCDAEGCDYEMDDYFPIPNYCPNCGAKVVSDD